MSVTKRTRPVEQYQTLFHNTSDLKATELEEATQQANFQSSLVLDFYRRFRPVLFTPSECHKKLINLKLIHWKTPITSIRRAITELTKSGKLAKTKQQRTGPMGRPEYCWAFNDDAQ